MRSLFKHQLGLLGRGIRDPATAEYIIENTKAACSVPALQSRCSVPNVSARPHSALPQPQFDSHTDSDIEDDHCRDHHFASSRREQWRASLPSPAQVSRLLQQKPPPAPATPPPVPADEQPLSWEDVITKARAAGLHLPHDQVLTDSFGRRHSYLRISLTERCNLRCMYCMPEEGVDLTPASHLLTVDEVERLTRLFAASGVTKVRLTGGEPTLRRDLAEIVGRVAAVEGVQAVGLTSNGIALGRSLPELHTAGLSLLNISLDTLRADRFEAMTRRKGHARVLAAISSAISIGFDPVKVNVVVMRGVNDDEIADFVELTRNDPINVRFIEYMPFDGNVWSSTKLVPFKEMMERAGERHGGAGALIRCADPSGEVAKNFTLPGHAGSVSFVSSMTSAFCGDCNRLRIMADGNIKVCLFGANEVSLRDAMRGGASDDDLRAVVAAAVQRKKAAHAGMFELARTKNRAMVKIGG